MGAAALGGVSNGAMPDRVPVLVELFTSEGCSSCPPADKLLARFEHEPPVRGVDVVVLSEHVDYWNSLGWRDPFSSAAMTQRQRDYAGRLHGDVYTPEMVVDGAKGFVGSSVGEALQAIAEAAKRDKAAIAVGVERAGAKSRVSVRADKPVSGTLFVALARDEMRSKVTAGENSGKDLLHVAVVYSMVKVGKWDGTERTVDVDAVGGGSRVVAFVSDGVAGRVVALGTARP
jgi:hypothetical protein